AFTEKATEAAAGERMVKFSPAPHAADQGQPITSASGTDGKKTAKGKTAASRDKSPAIRIIKKKKSDSRSPEVVEAEIADAEKRLSEISDQMSRPEVARDVDRFMKLNTSRATSDRKSTRLNSSHQSISYAVSCTKQEN